MELDEAVVRRIVGIAVDDPSMEVAEWSVRPLGGGMTEALGISEGVSRVAGLGLSKGRRIPWSVILKVLKRAADHDDPADWDYWKREAMAYDAGLLLDLGDGLVAPRCFAVGEIDDDRVAIWLEDIEEVGPRSWPIVRYGLAARHIGRFNGGYLTGRALPDWSWLSPGRLRQWLSMSEPGLADLPRLAAHPIGTAWLTDDTVDRIQRQWRDRERLLRGLDRLPPCLCHHDAFRRNLIAARAADGREQTAAIDWVGVGRGIVGDDLAALVAITLQFLDVDVSDAAELDRIAYDGYVAGLRDVGASIDEREVRFGYAATANLLIGVAGTGGWLRWLLEDDRHPKMAEGAIGHPIDEVLAHWRRLQPFLLDLGDEAHRLGSELGWT